MRRTLILILAVGVMMGAAVPAFAARGGVPGSPIAGDMIWADGELFGTIAQGSLPYNGNDGSFDQLFLVPGQNPVAEAAPGPDYNGGRWLPTPVTWNVAPYLIDSYEGLMTAAGLGHVSIGSADTGAAFLCPLIPNH